MTDCAHSRPCGYFSDPQKACTCAPVVVTKYQKRISGHMLDLIDIYIKVPRVDYERLSGDRMGETSESIRKRVQAARLSSHLEIGADDRRFGRDVQRFNPKGG